MTTIAAHRLALAVPLQQAAADLRAEAHAWPRPCTSSGVPPGPVARRAIFSMAGQVLDVAAAADVVLAARHLEDAAADVVVRGADGGDDLLAG